MTENFAVAVRWLTEQDALLRGLAHALSNRVGTLVAATGLLEPGAVAPASIVGVLRDETERLEGVLVLVRLLAGSASDVDVAEPLHLPDLVTPIVELHAHHPQLRDVPVTVTPDPLAPPVRARHVGLARALLLLLGTAKRGAAASIAWTLDGDDVALTVSGAAGDEASAAAARWLAGVPVEATAAGYVMRLPRV
ncbi:hypothetical protein J421_0222 [Gemmatirosa kalamazoonensis]|uniref:Histidine kinase A domain protein n=1 Tax=Gemmatirosa kalamazoonensis TaxID=861299 RepID=W0R9J3_9BACT|nr:hypothetical protein [Gemmatirosa kalamazoonensis]AHG87759.1 hypothetical protein J421_0222 [Gemmatirosa kalamazoonensis]